MSQSLKNIILYIYGIGCFINLMYLGFTLRAQCIDDRGIIGFFWCPESSAQLHFGILTIKSLFWPITIFF